MKITNKFGLPDPLVRAVSYSDRNRGDADFTVTELIKPPRIGALEAKYRDEIEEDASDRLWALIGSAGHEVLRRSARGEIVERRLTMKVEYPAHDGPKIATVSGQLDLCDGNMYDYKIVSRWVVRDGLKPEWEQQLNAYRLLASHNAIEIGDSKIIAILRDWSKREAARDRSYPQSQVVVLDVPIWPAVETEQWLGHRIRLHMDAHSGDLPECTPEEMWESPTIFAVKKIGAKRALKLYEQLDLAACHAAQPGLEMEVRPSERPRCESYCAVAPFCSQFKAWKGELI